MLDNNYQNKIQNQQFGTLSQQQAQTSPGQPPMQAVNPELLKENIQDSYVANRLSEDADNPKAKAIQGLVALPAWYGIAAGMDKFAAKSRGDYQDTVHAKIGNFGDRISNSSFFQSKSMKWLNKTINNSKNKINNYILQKTRLTRGLQYAESKPELGMVRAQAEGMIGILAQDYTTVTENFFRESTVPSTLRMYGASDADIARFETAFSNAATPDAKKLEMQKAEFECLKKYSKAPRRPGVLTEAQFLSKSPAEKANILNDMKAFEIGHKNYAKYKIIKDAPHEHLPEILEASLDSNKNMYSSAYEAKSGWLNKLKHKFVNRNVYFSEFANKMAASLGKKANEPVWKAVLQRKGLDTKLAKTKLGRLMSLNSNLILEGATNRVAGGKLAALFQAVYLAEVIYKSAKQEGGISEKAKSFAERFAEMIAFFTCIPIALKLMHKAGGLQYLGMSADEIKNYRNALKLHQENAINARFADKAAWKTSRDGLLERLKLKGPDKVKNPIYRLLKKAGRIITVGLEQIRPYQKEASVRKTVWEKITDMFKSPKHFKFGLKQMAGYPMRIILGMMVILPFLSKLVVKGTHMIVGKPKHSLLDEDKEAEMAEQQAKQQQTQLPPQLQNPQTTAPQQTQAQTTVNTQPSQSPTNLLNPYKNPQQNTVNNTTTNTVNNTVNNNTSVNPPEPVRTYIPSQVSVINPNSEDTSAVNAAMMRAASAEQQALETLKMN